MKTWKERIKVAKERGKFTRNDKERADKWPTCAVGEYGDKVKHGYYDGPRPADYTLLRLGYDFNLIYLCLITKSRQLEPSTKPSKPA